MRFSRVLGPLVLVAVVALAVTLLVGASASAAHRTAVTHRLAHHGAATTRVPSLRSRSDACTPTGRPSECAVQPCALDIGEQQRTAPSAGSASGLAMVPQVQARSGVTVGQPGGPVAAARPSRIASARAIAGLNPDEVPVGGNCQGFKDSP